jgi:anti-sigma B factor antagonist
VRPHAQAARRAGARVNSLAEITVELQGASVVARLKGEVDMTNASWVHDELLHSVPNGAIRLIVDLSATRYLDSAAIALLFDVARRLSRRRQGLRLVMPDGSPLERVLELTEVATVAPIHGDLDSALAE